MNLRCLKRFRAYSISFKSSNFGNFFLELNCKGLHQSSGKEKESCCLVFSPREIVALSRRSRALTAKKCTKKRDAKLLLSQSKPMAVLPFSLPSLLRKLPIVSWLGVRRREKEARPVLNLTSSNSRFL